jgi:hypothetical protein
MQKRRTSIPTGRFQRRALLILPDSSVSFARFEKAGSGWHQGDERVERECGRVRHPTRPENDEERRRVGGERAPWRFPPVLRRRTRLRKRFDLQNGS